MGHDIFLWHPDSAFIPEESFETEEVELQELSKLSVGRFLENLIRHGYRDDGSGQNELKFFKDVEGCPVQVWIKKTEIVISIPYWKNFEKAVTEAQFLIEEEEIRTSFYIINPQENP